MSKSPSRTEADVVVTIIITDRGEVVSPWWTPEVEEILEALGIEDTYPGEVLAGEKHLCG